MPAEYGVDLAPELTRAPARIGASFMYQASAWGQGMRINLRDIVFNSIRDAVSPELEMQDRTDAFYAALLFQNLYQILATDREGPSSAFSTWRSSPALSLINNVCRSSPNTPLTIAKRMAA